MQKKEIDQDPSSEQMQASTPLPPSHPRSRHVLASSFAALGAGAVGSLLTIVLMGILRLVAGIPTPVELFGDFVLKHISVTNFIRLLTTFGSNAKTAPLGLALIGMVVLGTLLGLLYAALVRVPFPVRGYQPARREWLTAAALAVAMAVVAVILFWNELRQNFLGLPLNWTIFVTGLALLADFSLYGLTLSLVYRALVPKQLLSNVSATDQGRRQLFTRAGIAVLSVGAVGGTLGLMRGFLNNKTTYDGTIAPTHNGFTAPITPNSEHYIVTQNPIDPTPEIAVWRLELTGLVGNAGTYTYEELQNVPSTSRAITLECISNGASTGGHLISTAVWQGVTLRSLLERHGGAQASAHYVAFYSVDGYNTSLPLDEVLAADAFLAWRMNGVALPQRHGFPLRVLIPGRYGEEQPKWLTRIALTDSFVGGLYSDQGWYNGPLHTMSRIDRPAINAHLPIGQGIEVGGIAFAGNRDIQKVEVSTNRGVTWQQATLQPSLSPDAWVLWTWQWTPSSPGKYTVITRATDGTGAVQTSHKQGTVPNGETGYPMVIVQVG